MSANETLDAPCIRASDFAFSTQPDPYNIGRKPSVASTTTNEITDDEIGLLLYPVAQRRAEDYISAALAFRHRQEERSQARRRPITSIHIALAADD